MEKENLAIRISGVKKEYRLGSIGGRTLQADLQSWFARKRGREDPNVKIGQDERLVGQKFMALNGIDLTICQGEMCGIIGSNGAGKSTLLYSLSGIDRPTSGKIVFDGSEITSYSEDDLALFRREKCGFVFQQIYLIDNMSLLYNVLTASLLHNKNKSELAQKTREMFVKVNLY